MSSNYCEIPLEELNPDAIDDEAQDLPTTDNPEHHRQSGIQSAGVPIRPSESNLNSLNTAPLQTPTAIRTASPSTSTVGLLSQNTAVGQETGSVTDVYDHDDDDHDDDGDTKEILY